MEAVEVSGEKVDQSRYIPGAELARRAICMCAEAEGVCKAGEYDAVEDPECFGEILTQGLTALG